MPQERNVELTRAAEDDIADILDRSAESYGGAGRERYEALIATAMEELRAEPLRRGSRDRPDLGVGTRTYHLRHSRDRARIAEGIVRSPRHLLVYEQPTPARVVILRVLHDSMDFARHLPGIRELD